MAWNARRESRSAESLEDLRALLDDEEDDLTHSDASSAPAEETLPVQQEADYHDVDIEERPAGIGTRWRDIEDADRPAVWEYLRKWVDWFVYEYELSVQVVPACWYRHRVIVAELYAMMVAELKVWEEGTGGTTAPAFQFQGHVEAMKLRLSNLAGKCLSEGKHVEPRILDGVVPNVLQYNESDWNQFVTSTSSQQSLPRDKADRFWRRVVKVGPNEESAVEMVSEEIRVSAQMIEAQKVLQPVRALASAAGSVDVESVSQGGLLFSSMWQYRFNDHEEWQDHEISREYPVNGDELPLDDEPEQ